MATAKNILIVLLIFVLGFFVLGDSKYIKEDNKVITKIDTLIKDTTIYKYKKGKDIPFVVLDTLFLIDSLKIHDTAYIVKDYKEVKLYSDTLHIDTAQYVYVHDTISQNRILGRGYGGHFIQKTITIRNDIYHKPKNELYLGLIGDYRRFDEKLGVGIGVIYKKQKEGYTLNYTTNQISIGLYKKLF
jgi:hypothetical protein